MYNKQIQRAASVTWHRYSYKGYGAFASLALQIRIGVLSVATLATVAPVQAQQHSQVGIGQQADDKGHELEEVAVTGTLAPLAQLQSARIVSVLSRTDIERAGVQSINDLFKLVSGVDVRQRGGFGIQTDISINGGTYEQVTILLNGVNLSNPHTGHLAADFPVGIPDIDRIEILEGAASRVYGGQAFGGAVNIVTRTDRSRTLSLGAEGGSHGTAQGDARFTWIHREVAHRASGGGGRSGGGTLNDAWSKGQFYYQGDLRSRTADLHWQAGFSRKAYGANTFYSGSSNDQWEQNERYLISVGAETKGRVRFLPTVYWNRTYDNYHWHKGTPTNSHLADVYGARLRGRVHWAAGQTAFGAELRDEGILSSALGVEMDSADFLKARGADMLYTKRASRTNVSCNLEHNLVLERWTLSAGLLANRNPVSGHRFRFYPGVDLAWRPAARWRLFLSYNKGFRLPSYTDLYYSSPDITGNAQLRPEENHSLSLGARWQRPGVSLTARTFYSRGTNLIDYVKQAYGEAARADNFNLDNLGAQADARIDFPRLLGHPSWLHSLCLGYTWLHQRREGKYAIFTSLYASDYLRHKFTASFSHALWSRLSATWSLRWQDRRGQYQVYDGLKPTAELRPYHAYATLDLKFQWTAPRCQVYVQGTNLTNQRYQDLGNVPQPGLWLMAGARWVLTL